MTRAWPRVPLVDLVVGGDLSYGVVQPGSDQPDGVPIVRVKDLDRGRIDTRAPIRVNADVASRYTRTRLKGGELLVSVVGTVGESAVVPPSLAGWNVARAIAVVKPEGVTAAWLHLAFQTQQVRAAISSALNTTVQATLNLADLKRISIPLPPSGERQAIAEVLGALDDKITANDRALSVGDSLVRADFAHLSGEPITLEDLVTSVREQVDPTSRPAATPYVGLEHVPRRRMWLQEFGTAKMVASAKSSFQEGDVLFGKLRPYFHKVVRAPSSGIASTDILVLRAKRPELAGLALAAASSDGAVAAATGAADGTRMPRANWSVLKEVLVPWPGETEAVRFSRRVDGVARLAAGLAAETRALGSTRDELLPLLMSGRLRVKDAEKVVAEVV